MEDKAWIRQRAYRVIVVEHQENRVEESVTKFIFVITATTSTSKTSELPCIAVVRREALVFKLGSSETGAPTTPRRAQVLSTQRPGRTTPEGREVRR